MWLMEEIRPTGVCVHADASSCVRQPVQRLSSTQRTRATAALQQGRLRPALARAAATTSFVVTAVVASNSARQQRLHEHHVRLGAGAEWNQRWEQSERSDGRPTAYRDECVEWCVGP